MDASIKDNICFGSDDFTNLEIINSIEKSNLTEFVNQLPEGINTIIGEKVAKYQEVNLKE